MKPKNARNLGMPILALAVLLFPPVLAAGEVTIIVKSDANEIVRFAGQELRKHLGLILGQAPPIKPEPGPSGVTFYVGVRPPNDAGPFEQIEEARYAIDDEAVYLYGDDEVVVRYERLKDNVTKPGAIAHNRMGTLFATYFFLEAELGVRWVEPGDAGISYERQQRLELTPKRRVWRTHCPYERGIRSYVWNAASQPSPAVPAAFLSTKAQAAERRAELEIWQRRMRLGTGIPLRFGHAFSTWWEKYGEQHPEYFALNGKGVRGPMDPQRPDRVKICPSSPGVVQQAVTDWLKARKRQPASAHEALCVGVNDGGGQGADEFCHCEACQSLDVRRPNEPFGQHLTDRYMYLANQALVAARKHDPTALVTAYAYASVLQPPRRERLQEGIVLQFVPRYNEPFERTAALYQGWQDMGCRTMLFRPNDCCSDFGLPLGFEQRLFEHQQLAIRYGAKGMDHDCCYGFWTGISSLAYYALSRAHIDPTRDFAYWADHYADAFGAAKEDVKAFHRYWRNKFDTVILPADQKAQNIVDGIPEGRGFLRWSGQGTMAASIHEFYGDSDFDVTDAILQRARGHVANDPVRSRLVDRLIVANQHSRLTFEVLRAVALADMVSATLAADKLMEFRTTHQTDLRMNWRHLFHLHAGTCGVDVAALDATYDALTKKGQSLTAVVNSADDMTSNGGFEDGMRGWNRGRWHANPEMRKQQYARDEETKISIDGALEGSHCLMVQVKPENQEFVYGVNQHVGPLEPGTTYLFRFGWKRRTAGDVDDLQSLEWPRFRLTFMDENKQATDYGAIQSPRLWGSAGNTKTNTEWIQVSRLIRLSAKSRIRWVDITFHFSSQSLNMIDNVRWLALTP